LLFQLITDIPDTNHSHLWDVNKEKHIPLVNTFDPISHEELKSHLDDQVHGATTEIIKTTDFTQNGFAPKCFLPFYSAPGKLPRKVQIDRLKRLYHSMNISDLLSEMSLEPEKLMPRHRPADEVILLNVPNKDPAPFPPFLPLHYFDDENYEIWNPQEWLDKGVYHHTYKPLPGRALLPDVPSNVFSKNYSIVF
jgi:dynein heavy chain